MCLWQWQDLSNTLLLEKNSLGLCGLRMTTSYWASEMPIFIYVCELSFFLLRTQYVKPLKSNIIVWVDGRCFLFTSKDKPLVGGQCKQMIPNPIKFQNFHLFSNSFLFLQCLLITSYSKLIYGHPYTKLPLHKRSVTFLQNTLVTYLL